MADLDVKIAKMESDLDYVKKAVTEIRLDIKTGYVSQDTYKSDMRQVQEDIKYLKNLVYGAVGTFIALAIGAAFAGNLL